MTRPEHLEELMNALGGDDLPFSPSELEESLPVQRKPIVSQEVEDAALDAIAQFLNREQWSKWGMDSLREQGSCVCIEGPPGTGKTTLAAWMAKKVKKGFLKLSGAEIGGGNPGESERNVIAFFNNARRRKNATIFMDECDHLLMDRESISSEGTTWQLGTVETLMVQINTYPGLVICATNHVKNLDPALADRFIAIIHVPNPDMALRVRLWKNKIPRSFPFQPDDAQLRTLAKAPLTGRTIENVLVSVASHCIRKDIKPNMSVFSKVIEREVAKKIPSK